MDKVDIENVEDLNELEARLYSQIHHEAIDKLNVQNKKQISQTEGGQMIGINNGNDKAPDQIHETSSNINRILSRRYWASDEHTAKKGEQEDKKIQNSMRRLIRNTFTTPYNKNEQRRHEPSYSNKSQNQLQSKQYMSHAEKSTFTNNPKDISPSPSSCNEIKKCKAMKAVQCSVKQNHPAEISNLKINPVADWMERKKSRQSKKANSKWNNINAKNSKMSSINIKQGLFARQELKLQKAKRYEEKKQKSKKAQKSAAIANKIKRTEVIDLDSDNESDSSDIIMVPTVPPPTFTVDDSADEGDNDNESIRIDDEENALDSTDVQLLSTAGFIKPQKTSTQILAAAEGSEKRLENSSRCTSPCSIQSSDDFIGQTDRSRLLVGASGTADDEDLLVLTSDINSLLEIPDKSKQVDATISLENKENKLDYNMEQVQKENTETNFPLEFATPKPTKRQSPPRDYRVDQGQFRALDVYDSESDITDSVYSKGANNSTVIRQIDTSADEVEDIGICSQRTKRLRKRRASSSNKELDQNNEIIASSSDNEEDDEVEEDEHKLSRTAIPFISKGIAVERFKTRKTRRTLAPCSPILHKRKSGNKAAPTNHMSDTQFIATLNNLAQGQEDEHGTQVLEEGEESETENIPTAREIAEKILAQHSAREKNNKSDTDDIALPNDIVNELNDIFETIDQLDRPDANTLPPADITDSSGSDREKDFIYKSLPNEEAQIIKYSQNKSKTHKSQSRTLDENGSPIYNVIYTRGRRKPGGIGWNDEMRKFYNESWNGEHFMLSKILQKLNPDKSLWKIYTQDRFNIRTNKRNNIKCTNCCEFGHMRSKCKRPRKPMICYMCGDSGHCEPRCPNTICLRCGNKTQVFTKICHACSYQNRLTCPICQIRGHSLDYCPDKWRRYHSTTEPNIHPNNSIDYNPRKYCCVCGARGHISDNCRSAVRFSEYPAITSTVKSHQKSYSDVAVKSPYNGIALNLMYEPFQEYKFDIVERTSSNKYYGRFLRAVGMDYLFKRKRNINTVTMEIADTSAKKAIRLSKKYEANPYLKVGTINQINIESKDNAPNQVQEITESGNADQPCNEKHIEKNVINVEDKSDNDVEVLSGTVMEGDMKHLHLNTINERPNTAERQNENFKSPKNTTPASLATPFTLNSQKESPIVLDSDSNYSFSEHFDVASSSADAPPLTEISIDNGRNKNSLMIESSKPTPYKTEILPDFIPLIDSTEEQNNQHGDNENTLNGISKMFVTSVESDCETEENRRTFSPLAELPSEAKIYLTHFHSKYLLSPAGNSFLVKTSQAHKLKARLDFSSVGYVLLIFGLPINQDRFQRELLIKFRQLEDERNEKQVKSNINVPKRTCVLIRFLRDNIAQLMNNIGNVNHLLKRLQFLERQQTKTGYKLAEKVRKSLNMILVGQAGLLDGTKHLDKLLINLKKLLNDVNTDVAPSELRSEITDHWKFIFSSYRHENYQKLVDTYNKLISKNRMPQLNIDPILMGQKLLNTSFSEEQKQKLEQESTAAVTNITNTDKQSAKQFDPNFMNEKAKLLKRQQNPNIANTSSSSATTAPKRTMSPTVQKVNNNSSFNNKTKPTSNNAPSTTCTNKRAENTSMFVKTTKNSSISLTYSTPNANETSKNRTQKIMPPPLSANHETLLSEISSENPITINDSKLRDSKLPSPFWSRESMRYLDDCVRLAAGKDQIMEKLQRVQNKSKNGQLSYNDYLAIIKLHTALNGK